MPYRHLRDYSIGELRQCILDQLGEAAGGLTQGELLSCFTSDRTLRDLSVFYSVLLDALVNETTWRYSRSKCGAIYQLTTHAWLKWAKARQEEDERRRPA